MANYETSRSDQCQLERQVCNILSYTTVMLLKPHTDTITEAVWVRRVQECWSRKVSLNNSSLTLNGIMKLFDCSYLPAQATNTDLMDHPRSLSGLEGNRPLDGDVVRLLTVKSNLTTKSLKPPSCRSLWRYSGWWETFSGGGGGSFG